MSDKKNINETVHFEQKGVNVRVLASIALLIIFGAFFMHFFLYLLYLDFTNPTAQAERSPGTFVKREEPMLKAPRLQDKSGEDLNKWREQENIKLNYYGWIDRRRGIVHIPIQQAMDKVLKNGLPNANQANQTATPIQK